MFSHLWLEIGADDYVVKPFSVKEVVARVRRLDLQQALGEFIVCLFSGLGRVVVSQPTFQGKGQFTTLEGRIGE